MNIKNKRINFSKIQNNSKNNNEEIKNVEIHKLNLKKSIKANEINNVEIDLSLKKVKKHEQQSHKKYLNNKIKKLNFDDLNLIDYSKNKMLSIITLPYTISSSQKRIARLVDAKKNSWITNINNNNENKIDKDSKQLCINISTEPNHHKKMDINSLQVKKNIVNIHHYKKLNYKERNSQKSKNLSIDYYNAFQCLFCEQVFQENDISKLIKCEHKFCNKCGENFYYDLVNKGHNNKYFKCPFVKCKKEIPYNIIELLLASKNFDTLRIITNKQEGLNNESNNNNLLFKDKEDYINEFFHKNTFKKRNIKRYDNKNIIDINNLKSDYIFGIQSKKNLILCPLCKNNDLYKNASKYFFKCLYCKNKFCKYCVKPLTDNHFDIDNLERCKVFFRINNSRKKKFIVIFFRQIFLMIAGYLFLMSFFVNKMKEFHKRQHKYSIIQIILKYFIYSIICILILPVFIIIIPYYPIISCF